MESESALTDRARRLVEASIESVGRLDVLILMYDDPSATWTGAQIAKRMRAPRRWAVAQLRALEAAGLLRSVEEGKESAWKYDPVDAKRAAAEELMSASHRDRAAVVAAVFATRPLGARAFSDAFRLRRPS